MEIHSPWWATAAVAVHPDLGAAVIRVLIIALGIIAGVTFKCSFEPESKRSRPPSETAACSQE